jgi:hypothetical protein
MIGIQPANCVSPWSEGQNIVLTKRWPDVRQNTLSALRMSAAGTEDNLQNLWDSCESMYVLYSSLLYFILKYKFTFKIKSKFDNNTNMRRTEFLFGKCFHSNLPLILRIIINVIFKWETAGSSLCGVTFIFSSFILLHLPINYLIKPVGIATGYGIDGRGLIPLRDKRFFSTPYRPDQLGAYSASYPMSPGSSFFGVKRPGRETDHSPPSSAEVKNGGAIPPLPLRLHGVVLNFLNSETALPLL